MKTHISLWRTLAAIASASAVFLFAAPANTIAAGLENAGCLTCHDSKSAKIEVADKEGKKHALGKVESPRFDKSMHGEMQCVDCHHEITDNQAKHVKAKDVAPPNCISCHEALWEKVKKDNLTQEKSRLGLVVKNIDAYKLSFHAREDKDNPGHPKAFCEDCHSSHAFNVPPAGTSKRSEWHKEIPKTCGAKCHEDQYEDYKDSVHGKEVLDKGNIKAAVCTDCHTTHSITNTSSDKFKLANVNACGTCHTAELKAYADTYHGQVNKLGYVYTARCPDCHGSHEIKRVDDPKSKVHPDNRLKTCAKCHSDTKPGMHQATQGFLSFAPHANTHDFEKFPQMWIASKAMSALLIFVFAFFWAHCGLWYYREWKDRKEGKSAPHINTNGLQLDEKKHFERFALGWRIGHFVLLLCVMTLVLTGMTALYAETNWAPVVASIFGGPRNVGLVHRIAASGFAIVFLIHFVYVMQKLLRSKTFRWFGPDSLIPNWKDVVDCWGMFKWFLGKGPRPQLERWAYFEKFDYWAVFWGLNIIGWSGLMLAIPHITAQYLPGWVFNVATLIHGEEAFLAAVFLFTVHFFNNHFRPDKLPPPDVVMFTGTQSLEEFRHDHPAQYKRLLDSGELQKRLVDAPSLTMTRASKILGIVLILIGLSLLVLVAIGFFGGFN